MSSLDAEALSDHDHRRIAELLAFTTNLEHAGDVAGRDLLGHAAKRLKRGLALPPQMAEALTDVFGRLAGNLRLAASVFMTADVRAARLLAGEKEAFRALEAAATEAHFAAMRSGSREDSEMSAWRLDLLRDLTRINAHLVAAAAYPVLESQGELLPTRLRGEG